MDYKLMSDSELRTSWADLASELGLFFYEISEARKNYDVILIEEVRSKYKVLKQRLREDAKYFGRSENYFPRRELYSTFSRSVQEAAAYGLLVKTTGKVDDRMHDAVETAYAKLTKLMDDETRAILNNIMQEYRKA